MSYKQYFGQEGEEAALDYLTKSNYKLIQKNYRCKFGEIDIIAKDKDYIVFIEVKTRITDYFGMPSEAVNDKKRSSIVKSATNYLVQNKMLDHYARFDVVEVLGQLNDNNIDIKSINLIQNAFEA